MMPKEVLPELNIKIIEMIADHFKINTLEIFNRCRKRIFSDPRQISMYFIRKYSNRTVQDIGKQFNRDHSAVIRSVHKVEGFIKVDKLYRANIEQIENKLNQLQYLNHV